jgi:hypothetical protein
VIGDPFVIVDDHYIAILLPELVVVTTEGASGLYAQARISTVEY